MTVDWGRYRDLQARTAFAMNAYTGSIQDQSAAQRAMSFVGAPTWGKINGLPCLNVPVGSGTIGAAIPRFIDATGAVWIETLLQERTTGVIYIVKHAGAGNAGGMSVVASGTTLTLYLLDLAGASRSATVNIVVGRTTHAIIGFSAGGASAVGWLNGVPVAPTVAGAAVPANFVGNQQPSSLFAATAIAMGTITRVWQGTPTNEDCVTLDQAAKTLVGGEI